jgi:hypothetical protein
MDDTVFYSYPFDVPNYEPSEDAPAEPPAFVDTAALEAAYWARVWMQIAQDRCADAEGGWV